MWFEDQIILPRIARSFLWMIVIQEIYLSLIFLILKIIAWNPFSGFIEWLFYLIHWKTLTYRGILCFTTVAFGALNRRFYCAEKHICSTRFEKLCRALSPRQIQHFIITTILGGVASYCCIKLFQNFDPDKQSLLSPFLILEDDFEHFFVVQHGCYTAIMFNLKYFICFLYLVKFSLNQETKIQYMKRQAFDLVKDSIICVLKGLHWFYLLHIFTGPVMENRLTLLGFELSANESYVSLLHSVINMKLLLVTFMTGVIIFLNWSLYLYILNVFIVERHVFPIEIPVKSDKSKSLSAALKNSESDILKYLAVVDFRLMAQQDPERRKQIFAISHPGGHPHQWKAVSDFCMSSLNEFVNKLHEYCIITAAKESKLNYNKGNFTAVDRQKYSVEPSQEMPLSEKVIAYLRKWPIVAYFLDELPSTKIRKLFTPSQPLIWMIEALGYLVSASYTEDKFGVIQQTLPDIIRLLLDMKVAEEKLPIDLVGIRTHVKDPYGRYEHIHQRVALKNSVNASLCRIADTFKNDINGIYLPEEYLRYLQRYLNRKNI
ncbi:nucleoporin NDC1 [Nephila pilipes]|uniref:Nucleoporin NDC1 n=1 Tax=Nephila pilipes TaxID=299642 RepID=A0A8X6QE77_NEPPI|nr:nucleoporin NDC1 [Nephila pilipes]